MPEEREATVEQGLQHQLSTGQMALVAVGGSIGTGLLLGSAAALEIAGPGVIVSYALAAFIAWTVALALGELSSHHPAAGSFHDTHHLIVKACTLTRKSPPRSG